MALQDGDLCDVADVKAWLKLETTDADPLLGRLVTAISKAAVEYLDDPISADGYDERYDGPGGVSLYLRHQPIISISLLEVNDIAIPEAANTSSYGFVFGRERGDALVTIQGGYFARGRQNVHVVYDAGYDDIPTDIQQAVIEWVCLRFEDRKRVGIGSMAIQGESTTYLKAHMPDAVAGMLNPYRRVGLLG